MDVCDQKTMLCSDFATQNSLVRRIRLLSWSEIIESNIWPIYQNSLPKHLWSV